MIGAVLDVNVLISALLLPTGIPAKILESWREERFLLITSRAILAEFEEVVRESRFVRYGLTSARITQLLGGLRQFALVVPGRLKIEGVARDTEDDKLLACAVEGHADYLVSGDKDLLVLRVYEGVQIIKPIEFVGILEE
jgi:putative PIN family toxin of toxin-antitoxin system